MVNEVAARVRTDMGWVVAGSQSRTARAIVQFRSSQGFSAAVKRPSPAVRFDADQLKTEVTYPVEQSVKVRLVANFACERAVGRSGF